PFIRPNSIRPLRTGDGRNLPAGRAAGRMAAMRKGVPVSPGVAVARVYRIDEALARNDPATLDAAALSREVSRFENACAAAAAELDTVIGRVAHDVGEQEASIFRAHRLMLGDPALTGKVTNRILHTKVDAETALR